MTSMGFLIPEFPGQTHAFFIRERNELLKLGVKAELISTRHPVGSASIANHAWAEEAAKETSYLFPLSLMEILRCFVSIVLSGPRAWLSCLCVIFGKSDLRLSERAKMFPIMIAGAYLKRFCKAKGIAHVHIHSCANAANVGLFARLMGGPSYSLTLHGPMQDYGTNQAKKWQNAAYCIVITNELFDEVNRNLAGVDLPPIFLAPMGVNVDDFKRKEAYVPVQDGQRVKLVSCGRLNFVKAHDDLIRVVASLKEQGLDVQLNICGAADSLAHKENYQDTLIALTKELGVTEEVNFLGSISEDAVKSELESAHFFCLASLKEPLGVAIMEAMAMETPAIVARSPGVTEMIDDNIDGVLVEPRSPHQFVEAITRLIKDPDQLEKMAHAGREKVIQKFHSGVSASKIAEGLKEHAKAG